MARVIHPCISNEKGIAQPSVQPEAFDMPTVRPERVEGDGWHPQDKLVEGWPRIVGQGTASP